MLTKLQTILYDRRISQHEIAEVAGVSDAFISNILSGKKIPSVPVLKRIASHLKVTLDELVD